MRVHASGYGGAVERALDIGGDSMQGDAPEGGDVSKEALLAVKAEDRWEVATCVRRGRARSRRQRDLSTREGSVEDEGGKREPAGSLFVNCIDRTPPSLRRVANTEKSANYFAVLEVEDPPHPALFDHPGQCDGQHPSVEPLPTVREEEPPRLLPYKKRRQKKASGKLVAHVRFLQHAFRRSRMVRAGCWSRGGMPRLCWLRPVTIFACKGGRMLHGEEVFIQQKARAGKVLLWYSKYVALLRRVESGRTPVALVTFCKQGGVVEGIRRANGAAHGQDIHA